MISRAAIDCKPMSSVGVPAYLDGSATAAGRLAQPQRFSIGGFDIDQLSAAPAAVPVMSDRG
jgi:hypothetical protein